MRVFCCVVGDDNAGALNVGGFKVAKKIIFVTFVGRWDTVIA